MEQAKALRNYHNEIKSILLSKYSSYIQAQDIRLLDLGVGRGGDLHKWNKCDIQRVVGIDINKDFIKDAIKRYRTNKYFQRDYKLYYTTPDKVFSEFLNYRKIPNVNSFHIVSCMFAFHYFWETEDKLNKIMKQISEALKDNGYFIGVVPQGEVIQKMLTGKDVYTTQSIELERCYKHVEGIGDKIKFKLSGTLYFGESMISEEYLVFKDRFEKTALKYGLHMIEYENFEKYYVPKYNMNPNTREASFVNGTFAFIKRSNLN